MCGICGVIQIGGEPRAGRGRPRPRPDDRRDGRTAARTTAAPTCAPGVALGARRLSIVDVEGGHQPFSNEDGDDLGGPERRALQPRRAPERPAPRRPRASRAAATPRSCPHLYEEYGADVPGAAAGHVRHRGLGRSPPPRRASRATGSASSRSTTRDAAISLVFASELKSLLASGLVQPELDYEAIDAYLTLGFVPGAAHAARRRARSSTAGRIGSSSRTARSGASASGATRSRRSNRRKRRRE